MRRLLILLVAVSLLFVDAPTASAGNSQIEATRAKANKAAQQLADAETRLSGLQSELAVVESRAKAAQERIDQLGSSVQQIVVAQFMSPNEGLTLDVDDINESVKVDFFTRSITQRNTDAIDEFSAAAEDLAIASAELQAKKRQEANAIAELEASKKRLLSELASLEAAERAREAEAARQAAAAAAAAQSQRSASVAAPQPSSSGGNRPAPAVVTGGGMACPVAGPVSFADTWGAPRSGGRRHKGVDMMARTGIPVVAPVSGTVKHRGNSLGGLSYHLSGDNGHYYYGTHLSGYANVGAGHVSAGTVIGYVGDTGNARGIPHLHFEIHPNHGPAVNPTPAVRAACG